MIYLPVKFEFDWTKQFWVRVRKRKCWWTNGQKKGQTNRRNYTNFKRNLAMMLIYHPVKFEFDRTKHFWVRVRKWKCWRTNRQMNRQNYTNFERNLAMMVIYLPVKFEFNWTKRFRVRVRKQKCWRTDKKRTNKQTELHQFRKEPSYVGDLPPCQVWIWLDEAFWVRVRKWKCGRTDRRRSDTSI